MPSYTEAQHTAILEQYEFDNSSERLVYPPADYEWPSAKPMEHIFSASSIGCPRGILISEYGKYSRAGTHIMYGWFVLVLDDSRPMEDRIQVCPAVLSIEHAIIVADELSKIKYNWRHPTAEIRRALEAKEHPYSALRDIESRRSELGLPDTFSWRGAK